MNGYQIFEKYWDGLVITAGNPHLLAHDAVRLALRLAIHEAAGAQNDTALVAAQNEAAMLRQRLAAAQAEADTLRLNAQHAARPAIEQRIAENNQAQIVRINEWLATAAPAQYYEPTDTATAVIAAMAAADERIQGLLTEVSELRAKLDQAKQGWSAAQADADHYELQAMQAPAEIHVNGATATPVDPTPAALPGSEAWGRNHPAWRGMSDEEREQLYTVASGAMSWRRLDKDLRRNLAQRVIWAMSESGDVSQSQFDREKPAWMPSANSLATTLGPRWSDLAIPMPY